MDEIEIIRKYEIIPDNQARNVTNAEVESEVKPKIAVKKEVVASLEPIPVFKLVERPKSQFCGQCGTITQNGQKCSACKSLTIKKSNFPDFMSPNGRVGRKSFFITNIYCNVITFIVIVVLLLLLSRIPDISSSLVNFSGIIFVLICLLSTWIIICNIIKRHQDIGISGLYLLSLFIPFVGMFYIFYLQFKAGQLGTNEYGEDPRQNIQKQKPPLFYT